MKEERIYHHKYKNIKLSGQGGFSPFTFGLKLPDQYAENYNIDPLKFLTMANYIKLTTI